MTTKHDFKHFACYEWLLELLALFWSKAKYHMHGDWCQRQHHHQQYHHHQKIRSISCLILLISRPPHL